MEMNYIRFGEGNRTMVILPGLSLKPIAASAKAVIDAYQVFAKDYTVYLFDRRTDIEDDYSIEEMADDTIEKIEELGLKDLYLFGVSQGGMIAQYIALKRKDLVKKLVLASMTFRFPDEKSEEWLKLAEEKSTGKLIRSFSKMIYSEAFYRKYRLVLPLMFADLSNEEKRRFTIYAKACIGFDLSDRLEQIDVPTLVLGSRKDRIIASEDMIEMSQRIPDCEIYLYEGYAHAVYDEAPDFKERILDYFHR